MSDLQKRYAEWKNKVTNPNYKGRNKTLNQHQADNEVLRGDAWHNNEGQQLGLEKRQKYFEDPDWVARTKKLRHTEEWKENQKERCHRLNTDPEILARRYEANKVTWRAVVGVQGRFEKVKSFQQATGMNFGDKRRLLPHLYYYEDEGPGEVKTEKVYYTPSGYFPNMLMAMQEDGREAENYSHISHKPQIAWFKAMMKKYPDEYYIRVEPKRDWLVEIGKPAR